ncbi:hypothetical protein LWI29_000556 [Acer saccharum]|uniref:Reverse transcriptase domain-containing protein n=1 Tax=Acer saccharum TaxID=4024 RepID=A0AA39VXU1_ACESA|nr:hypothetical protein LWI29_000556 [Acer saccharum]
MKGPTDGPEDFNKLYGPWLKASSPLKFRQGRNRGEGFKSRDRNRWGGQSGVSNVQTRVKARKNLGKEFESEDCNVFDIDSNSNIAEVSQQRAVVSYSVKDSISNKLGQTSLEGSIIKQVGPLGSDSHLPKICEEIVELRGQEVIMRLGDKESGPELFNNEQLSSVEMEVDSGTRTGAKATATGLAQSFVEGKKSLFRDIGLKHEELRRVSSNIQQGSWKIIRKVESELDALLAHEETYWGQRSRELWLKNGDRNSKYFHSKALSRHVRNNISSLYDCPGCWKDNKSDIVHIIEDYFTGMFSSASPSTHDLQLVLDCVNPCLSKSSKAFLDSSFSASDIRKAVFDMHPSKAPEACLGVLNGGLDLNEVNKTLITLIPKVNPAMRMGDFRPISLCNVVYKVVSKALANRFCGVLNEVISDNQSAFIPGRLITDNAIIGFECMHALKRKKKGRTGALALKLGMSKAYDRVEWNFLAEMTRKLGFSDGWVNRIMKCVLSVSFSFLVNEGLSCLFRKAKSVGDIAGFRYNQQGPIISHLFFADDSMIFTKASENDCHAIKRVLELYGKASGQVVNFDKSALCVSKRVPRRRARSCARIIGVQLVGCHKRYLGLPSFAGKNKKELFSSIKDRVWNRLMGWQNKLFSVGGKEVLIKAVVQSIPTYSMSLFWIPCSLVKELYRLSARFWSFIWGSEIIEEGARWRISDGSSIRIYSDRWIPKPTSFKVVSHAWFNASATVTELKLPSGSWNETLIHASFLPEDASLILSIPCSSSSLNDSISWHYDRLGMYSVKSGYHLGVSCDSNPSPSGLSGLESWWKYLWRIKVPPKVKLLLWHACHEWIPTIGNLVKRRVPLDELCSLCHRGPESTIHALWSCPKLKIFRSMWPRLKDVQIQSGISFLDFIILCKSLLTLDDLEVFCVSIWRVWFLRNDAVHNAKVAPVGDVVPWAMAFRDEFQNANGGASSSSGPRSLVANSWRPQDRGHFKANSNAALDLIHGKVGVGINIRNHLGEVLASCAQPILAALPPALAKATTILRGFIFASESGILPCTIESDT